MITDKVKNKVIVAMDNEICDGTELIARTECSEELYGYKISSLWIFEHGVQVLKDLRATTLKDSNRKIILDMQKWCTDIPEIIEKQVKKAAPYADEIIACPMGSGNVSLKRFAKTCVSYSTEPICVVKMTHPGSDVYLKSDYTSMIISDCIDYEIKKIVIPATKELSIPDKELLNSVQNKFDIYATGFKVQGGQVKPMVDVGVTKFITGRAVYEAKDPLKAISEIYKEINE